MGVRRIEPQTSLGAQRGEAVVCVLDIGDPPASLLETVRSVLAHTPGDVPIVLEDRGDEALLGRLAQSLAGERDVVAVAADRGVASGSAVLAATAPADAVVVVAGCVVGPGWYDALREAVDADARAASATPLGSVHVPMTIPAGTTLEDATVAVSSASLRLRPRLPAAGTDCAYVRRGALELAAAAAVDGAFSARCVELGLCHVLADDVLVVAPRAAAAAVGRASDPVAPVARALGIARRSLGRLTVTIDARILDGPMNGTRRHILELLAAVAETGQADLTAITPDTLSGETAALLRGISGLRLVAEADADSLPPADVVHRPHQVSAPADLSFLAQRGERLVITHQDLISYHNPAYFPSRDGWSGYRALTRTALAVADHVVFFSAHARDDALAEQLVEAHRASVVHIGADHALVRSSPARSEPPPGADRLRLSEPVVLCLGTDYMHKNRTFALRLLQQLRRAHGFNGSLVLAGPRARYGSSAADEERILAADTQLAAAVLDLGAVSEQGKAWLLRHAALVLYPTVYEGFGLVPFEAAGYGIPCLWAPGTALSEVLSDAAAGIIPWDLSASAEQALRLLSDPDAAADNVAAMRRAAASLRWSDTAHALVQCYRRVCDAPPAPAGVLERAAGAMQGAFSEDAVRLVGPGGALPRDLERPLLALATHPTLGGPVFRMLKAGYRASHRLRRGSSEENGRP